MKLASAVAAYEERYIARQVEVLRDTLREGYSVLYAFDDEDGATTRVDVMGPRGMKGGNDGGFLSAPVPTVRLWSPAALSRPLAVAAANRNFPAALDAVAERARPLVGDEYRLLLALLATVREHAPRLRPRVPTVGSAFTSSGTPSLSAFTSCLGLGDLEESFVRAVA